MCTLAIVLYQVPNVCMYVLISDLLLMHVHSANSKINQIFYNEYLSVT